MTHIQYVSNTYVLINRVSHKKECFKFEINSKYHTSISLPVIFYIVDENKNLLGT